MKEKYDSGGDPHGFLLIVVILASAFLLLCTIGCTEEDIPLTCEEHNELVRSKAREMNPPYGKPDKALVVQAEKYLKENLKECE
jgi:hypothetical protein